MLFIFISPILSNNPFSLYYQIIQRKNVLFYVQRSARCYEALPENVKSVFKLSSKFCRCTDPNCKMEIDDGNKIVSSNDSHINEHSDQLLLVSNQLYKSSNNSSSFNLYSYLEEIHHNSMNNGYAELNDIPYTYPNVIHNLTNKVHSNLDENNIASDKSPNTSLNLENNNTCCDQTSKKFY